MCRTVLMPHPRFLSVVGLLKSTVAVARRRGVSSCLLISGGVGTQLVLAPEYSPRSRVWARFGVEPICVVLADAGIHIAFYAACSRQPSGVHSGVRPS
jgi:hypothetical protein